MLCACVYWYVCMVWGWDWWAVHCPRDSVERIGPGGWVLACGASSQRSFILAAVLSLKGGVGPTRSTPWQAGRVQCNLHTLNVYYILTQQHNIQTFESCPRRALARRVSPRRQPPDLRRQADGVQCYLHDKIAYLYLSKLVSSMYVSHP